MGVYFTVGVFFREWRGVTRASNPPRSFARSQGFFRAVFKFATSIRAGVLVGYAAPKPVAGGRGRGGGAGGIPNFHYHGVFTSRANDSVHLDKKTRSFSDLFFWCSV